jgi:hypothetical protein
MLAALLAFASILAGCVTALLLMIMMARFPLLLIVVLLACWVFSQVQDIVGNALDKRKVLSEQPFSGSIQDFFFCQEYPDKQQIIFEFDLSGR